MKTEPTDKAIAITGSQNIKGEAGLTKREYFAAMAMQGIIASNTVDTTINGYIQGGCVDVATAALYCADALINALNENK